MKSYSYSSPQSVRRFADLQLLSSRVRHDKSVFSLSHVSEMTGSEWEVDFERDGEDIDIRRVWLNGTNVTKRVNQDLVYRFFDSKYSLVYASRKYE